MAILDLTKVRIRDALGNLMPRGKNWRFVNASASYNEAEELVDITIPAAGDASLQLGSATISVTGDGTLGLGALTATGDLLKASRVGLTSSANRNIYGMAADTVLGNMYPGKTIANDNPDGGFDFIFHHDSASVSGGSQNRWKIPTAEGASYTLKPGQSMYVPYSYGSPSSAGRWAKESDQDALMRGELWATLVARIGRRDGEVRECSGITVVGVGGGRFRWHASNTDTAVTGMVGGATAAGRWKRILEADPDPQMFGAVGDGAANDTAAFVAWAAHVQAQGGGRAKIAPGTYRVLSPIGGTLCAFSGLTSLAISAHGTIVDETPYASAESSRLFSFTDCSNVSVSKPKVTSQSLYDDDYAVDRGLDVFVLLQGCRNVAIDAEITGSRKGVIAYRLAADPAGYKSRGLKISLKCFQTHYPYVGQFSGDRAEVVLDVEECGRNFYLYGCKGVSVLCTSVNQQVTSQIAAYSGQGCENVDVEIVDVDSDACVAAAPHIEITYGDSTAATMRNLRIDLNLKNPSGAPFSHALGFNKFSDGGGTPDVTGRGHVLNGLRIRGAVDNTGVAANHVNINAGTFVYPDVMRNVVVEDFVGKGASNIDMPLGVLRGYVCWRNVEIEGNVFTRNYYAADTSIGEIAFESCVAANFSASTSTTERHHYHACQATDGTNQGRESTGKRFQGFRVGSERRPIPDTFGDGPYVARASRSAAAGSLAGPTNIFRVKPLASVALVRVKYFLTADQADWNPATRDETFGAKTFTASINASGAWTLQSAIADEVTERTLGTASALTLTLVDGDASGAFIAAACTNYTGSAARGVFSIEISSGLSTPWVEAV